MLYGRTIFKSIRKFITLQLTMNLCAVGVSMICPFIGIDAPVMIVQMLWINLIMDMLGGLAFAGEAPLTLRELGYASLLALTVFPAELLRKLLRRLRGRTEGY